MAYVDNDVPDKVKEGTKFDLIVVGSGNGACGFLSECLKYTTDDYKILVLEEGQNYFYTSNVTHQVNWSKTYSSGKIFKLHNTTTSRGRPIISGRALTMGGGGSINYTMIHESSQWLADNIGHDEQYWNKLKEEFNMKLKRPNPFDIQTKFAKIILDRLTAKINQDETPYAPPNPTHMTANIPNLQDDFERNPSRQTYIFPTQFNAFGQRTNSGASIVDWNRVCLRCNRQVLGLSLDDSSFCKNIVVENTQTKRKEVYHLKEATGRVVLCGGSQSPRLLMKIPELLKVNKKIGKRVNDHICMPLALYMVKKEEREIVGPTDNYESIFATLKASSDEKEDDGSARSSQDVVNIDFFTGQVERLIYLASSLYLCYIPFNGFKRIMVRFPVIFTILSNALRIILRALVFVYDIKEGIVNVINGKPWGSSNLVVTTSLVKFNCVREGQYEKGSGDGITLNFFEDDRDFVIAEDAIKKNIDYLESIGSKPPFLFRLIFRFITKIPYEKYQVKRYVKNFSERTLLSEQHLAGGCIFGDVIDKGLGVGGKGIDSSQTGKVFETQNVHVADLSTVPLPRVSTQMTAYLIGHHVGKQLYAPSTS